MTLLDDLYATKAALYATKNKMWFFPGKNCEYSFPPKKGTEWEIIKGPLSDQKIKSIIEEFPGQKLLRIERNSAGGAKAFFSAPNDRIRAKALDRIYRLKGLYPNERAKR